MSMFHPATKVFNRNHQRSKRSLETFCCLLVILLSGTILTRDCFAYQIDGIAYAASDFTIFESGVYQVTFTNGLGFDGPMLWSGQVPAGDYTTNQQVDYQYNLNTCTSRSPAAHQTM